MAIMLDQLGLAPGQRVLEIGAGTGYNAALISHIVGEEGQVTSVDIDSELVGLAASTWPAWIRGRDGGPARTGAIGYPAGRLRTGSHRLYRRA